LRHGRLSVAGQRVDELSERALAYLRRDEIGFVFQAFQLMDELTAQENVELPALLAGYSPNEARARATELLEQVRLAGRARPRSLRSSPPWQRSSTRDAPPQ
jgi:putative ABC transport system ATP-binding protein